MGKKRARSEGSIYKEIKRGKETGRYWAQLPAGPDGRRPRRIADSEEAAVETLHQLHAERAAGRDHIRRADTIAGLVQVYLDTIEAQGASGNTLSTYRYSLGLITERIGSVRIEALTVDMLQSLANQLARQGLAPQTVRGALARLHAAYKPAVPSRVSVNPVRWDSLTLKKARVTSTDPLDAADLRRILDAADDLDTRGAHIRLAPAWWLAVCLGLRRGEIAGLRWIDVTFERAELKVRSQVARNAEGKSQTGQPTKTQAGVRTLPMGPRLVARLRRHWDVQQEERRHRSQWREHGMVLAQEDGTPYTRLGRLYDDLRSISDRIGISTHPHMLRHSFATAVADAGFSEAVIAALLGHERGKSATARYVHAKPVVLRAAVEAVEAALFPEAEVRSEAL